MMNNPVLWLVDYYCMNHVTLSYKCFLFSIKQAMQISPTLDLEDHGQEIKIGQVPFIPNCTYDIVTNLAERKGYIQYTAERLTLIIMAV